METLALHSLTGGSMPGEWWRDCGGMTFRIKIPDMILRFRINKSGSSVFLRQVLAGGRLCWNDFPLNVV